MRKWIITLAFVLAPALAWAELPSTYQVTGEVLEVKGDLIAVKKGKERWEIAVPVSVAKGSVKVGDKVTVKYRMTATLIEQGKAKKGK